MSDIQRRIGDWAATMFPRDTSSPENQKRAATGVLAHLGDELDELRSAVNGGDVPLEGDHRREIAFEAADCAILLFDLADLIGVDLLESVAAKQAINEARTWGAPDDRGVVRHVDRSDDRARDGRDDN